MPSEFSDILEGYILHGYNPGGFFNSVLANDMMTAMSCSHIMNTIPALKNLCLWIINEAPRNCWGSYEAVDRWCEMGAVMRRKICEAKGLQTTAWDILTEKVDQ